MGSGGSSIRCWIPDAVANLFRDGVGLQAWDVVLSIHIFIYLICYVT